MGEAKRPAAVNSALKLKRLLAIEFRLLHGRTPAMGTIDALYKEIHGLVDKRDGRSALCLSGGGIRSASFGLGVLQALARRKLLFEFHYLSTVSGGGYIGSWLSAWRARVDDDSLIERRLRKNVSRSYAEQPEIAGLRANSNYLTPKLGVMSADTWTLAALYIRNLFLNWLIFLPAIVAVLLLPVVYHRLLAWTERWTLFWNATVTVLAILLLLLTLTASVSGRFEKTRFRVTQGWFLWLILLPIYVAAILLSLSVVTGQGAIVSKAGDLVLGWGGDIGRWWRAATGTAIHATALGATMGAVIYALAWAFAWLLAFAGKTLFRNPNAGTKELFPGFWPWLAWSVAGAIAGGLVGFGYHLAAASLPPSPDVLPYPEGIDAIRYAEYLSNRDDKIRLFVVLSGGWVAMSMFLAESIYLGLTSYATNGDNDREWSARSSGWLIVSTLAWAILAALVLYARDITDAAWGLWTVAIGGAGAGIAGSWLGSSAKTLATNAGKRLESLSMTKVVSLAAVIFLAALAVLLSTILPKSLAYLQEHIPLGSGSDKRKAVYISVATLACWGVIAYLFAWLVNVNRFSSHAIYRNRLARAFLGSARGAKRMKSRTRDPFTDFDSEDNIFVRTLATPRRKKHPGKRLRLFPVINMALNAVGGDNLAWQERKAEPFAVTPVAAGNGNVGFWRTNRYGGAKGLSLATAMAVSGAAASPNQGYHSSPLVGLLMTLFNVRLGWWLGNPSRPDAAGLEGPHLGIAQIFQELFGLTTDRSKYIYLSDGGHFENLGIYEMVRRRCHLIVACDAGCDPDCAFEDLGNAVRKVWIDLGVQIDFHKIDIKKRGADSPGLYCAMATIRYPEPGAEPGHLLYLKPGFHGDGSQPADVTAYGLANPAFPHESTGDQFFSESQMESYRSLGSHIIDVVFGPADSKVESPVPTPAMGRFWPHIENYMTPKRPTPKRRPGADARAFLRFPLPRV